jgi:hypothetical protein
MIQSGWLYIHICRRVNIILNIRGPYYIFKDTFVQKYFEIQSKFIFMTISFPTFSPERISHIFEDFLSYSQFIFFRTASLKFFFTLNPIQFTNYFFNPV